MLFAIKDRNRIVLLSITYWSETPYVSEERPICRRRAHHGCPGLLQRRGNLVGNSGRERERRFNLRPEVALQTLESGLSGDKTRQERIECACTSSPTDHPVRHIPGECGAASVCDSLLPCGKNVPCQLSPQGMHVGATFSGPEQLREIARENHPV